ncbi:MAG: hypothetical protein ABIR19_10255 [Ginsengibacter sp.]
MRRLKSVVSIMLLFVYGCNTSPEIKKTDPLESGRGFIEASLKGNYDDAEKYLLRDSTNIDYFEGMKEFNSKQSDKEKQSYRDANIIIDSIEKINDSASVINYYNTYKMKPSRLKMVKRNSEWLVDFKYTFAESMMDK